jgi:hypothetical protein
MMVGFGCCEVEGGDLTFMERGKGSITLKPLDHS